jgi:hexosaminidase
MIVRSFVLATLLAAQIVHAAEPTIIPRPSTVEEREGTFELQSGSVLVADRFSAGEARRLADALAPALGAPPRVMSPRQAAAARRRLGLCRKTVRLASGCLTWVRFARTRNRRIVSEGYELDVRPGVATLRARDTAGLFYAAESFRQVLPPAVFGTTLAGEDLLAPCVRVVDQPRFRWRGAMLDSGRHFFPPAVVKKLIDLLALHKLNRFHWHLTDDQGWRLEIRKYPRLTSVGSMRAESPVRFLPHGAFLNFITNGMFGLEPTVLDGVPHGGFYTQDDVRDVVAYAAERHVQIVPEIDMPGHITSAIAAYPELGNTGVPIPVATTVGIHEDILNVEESTLVFLEDVLGEVLELFPGDTVHVGGDEVPVTQWEASPAAQQRIVELGLADAHGLATYVTNRVGTFLVGQGRRYIGWNDILRDGLAPDAAIMVWFGTTPAVDAAKAGRDVVMAPLNRTYFDYANAIPLPPDEQALLESTGANPAAFSAFTTTIEEAYAFEPIPEGLTVEDATHILGGQGQLWSEWIPDGRDLEAQGFPRLGALAEAVWTPAERRDYTDFTARLSAHLGRLDALDVCYFGRAAPQCP